MAQDDLKAFAKEIADAIRESKGDGGQQNNSGAYAGQPAQNVVLMVQDRQTGKTIPYSIDRETTWRKPVARFNLTNVAATIFTASEPMKNVMVIFANVSAGPRTFNFYHIPVGGSATTTNALNITSPLAIGGNFVWCGLGMKTGDFFQGLASSTTTVSCTVYAETVERLLR